VDPTLLTTYYERQGVGDIYERQIPKNGLFDIAGRGT
jgi:hypothetical protein